MALALRRYGVEIAASAATMLVVIALFVVLPFPRTGAPATAGDRALDGRTRYSLDTVTLGARPPVVLRWHPQPRLAPARGDALVVDGWAADAPARAPAAAVEAVVDGGAIFRAPTGRERDDVARYYGEPAYATSGFRLTIPPCALAPGRHRIAFRFVAADGRGYFRSTDDVEVDVTPSGATRGRDRCG